MDHIVQTSIRDQVALKLRYEIFSGKLAIGEQLLQETIASRYNISRMPVREAFLLLEAEGFIQIQNNKRAIVVGVTRKILEDHFATRILLETEITLQAALSNEDFSSLQKMVDDARHITDKQAYVLANEAFHRKIWDMSNNLALSSTCGYLWRGITSLTLLFFDDQMKRSIDEHQAMVDAMKSKDTSAIVSIVYHHIETTKASILTHFQKTITG